MKKKIEFWKKDGGYEQLDIGYGQRDTDYVLTNAEWGRKNTGKPDTDVGEGYIFK